MFIINGVRSIDSSLFSFLLCVVFVLISGYSSFKLNSPTILLNYNEGLPSNFSIEITGAKENDCFQWFSADPNTIHLTPVFEASSPKCSQRAIASSIASPLERKVTRVTALHEGKTRPELYCDVITDSVASIELVRTTDELYLEGPPVKMAVVAVDSSGHTFTSINGLQIDWKVIQNVDESTKHSGDEVVRILRFSDSDYQLDGDTSAWESRGMFGHALLLDAVNTGICTISASVMHSKSLQLTTPKILFKVLPNLRIHPSSSLYILKNSSARIFLETLHKGKPKKMDPTNVDVTHREPSIAKVTDDFSEVIGIEYGSTAVTYKSPNSDFPEMTQDVNVVKPAYIAFRISEGDFKTLVEMKIYKVTIDLYDENDNKIHPADNLRLMVHFPTRLFHVNSTTANGSYFLVQTIAPGSGSIRAEFKGVVLPDGTVGKDNSLSGSVDVRICQKLNIFPPHTLLPFDPVSSPKHEIQLKASGGTGQYMWASNNSTAVTFTFDDEKHGVAHLHVNGAVDLVITVTDRNNINFISTAKVSIQPVIDVETYPTVVEAEVGNVLIIPTALLAYESKEKNIIRKFDDCSKIEPSVEIVEKHVLFYEKEAYIPAFGKGCLSLQFRCKYPGHSRINIFYDAKDSSNTSYKTTTVLACYKPLVPVHPVRVAVLALGTSKEIAFEGGPRKWPLYKDGHYTELEASVPEKVKTELIRDPIRYNKDLTVFRVSCQTLGENTLTFRIGNHPSATNQHPAKSETSIKFICSEPHSIHLKLHQKKDSKKLLDPSIVKVPFYGNKQFSVDLWIKDSKGRKFANISSLNIQWDVSDKTLAQPEMSYSQFMTHENGVAGYRKVTRDFKDFKMTGASGKLQVRAKITEYRKDALSKEGITEFDRLKEISTLIDLKLVSLRDINADAYAMNEGNKEEEGYCDGDTCKA